MFRLKLINWASLNFALQKCKLTYNFISKTNMYECLKKNSSKIMIVSINLSGCYQASTITCQNIFVLIISYCIWVLNLSQGENFGLHVFPCRILAGTPRTNAPEIRVVVARFSNTRDRASCQTNSTAIIFA